MLRSGFLLSWVKTFIVVLYFINFNFFDMKLTVNQYNYKSRYYAVWCPILANTLRYHSSAWFIVDGIRYDDKVCFLANDFKDIKLQEYHELYFSRVTLPKFQIEYGGFLNFLLSCTPYMLKKFSQFVYLSYPTIYEDSSEVLSELDNLIYPYKIHS